MIPASFLLFPSASHPNFLQHKHVKHRDENCFPRQPVPTPTRSMKNIWQIKKQNPILDSSSLSSPSGQRGLVPSQGSVTRAVHKAQGHPSHLCSHTQEKQPAETHTEGNQGTRTWRRPGSLAPLAMYIPHRPCNAGRDNLAASLANVSTLTSVTTAITLNPGAHEHH